MYQPAVRVHEAVQEEPRIQCNRHLNARGLEAAGEAPPPAADVSKGSADLALRAMDAKITMAGRNGMNQTGEKSRACATKKAMSEAAKMRLKSEAAPLVYNWSAIARSSPIQNISVIGPRIPYLISSRPIRPGDAPRNSSEVFTPRRTFS